MYLKFVNVWAMLREICFEYLCEQLIVRSVLTVMQFAHGCGNFYGHLFQYLSTLVRVRCVNTLLCFSTCFTKGNNFLTSCLKQMKN